jgi:peptide-methionine (R)-S-oxide reductase
MVNRCGLAWPHCHVQIPTTGAPPRLPGAANREEVQMLSRRTFALAAAATAAVSGAGAMRWFGQNARAEDQEAFEITYSDEEWRARLTPEQYDVLRDQGTEEAGTSPLNDEKRAGTFICAGCDLPLFASATKFDSGTGWPSFYAPLDDAIGTSEDRSLFFTRTEVHCRRCGGHLGHVFDDGPPPTGMRYCMNGVALYFVPADAPAKGNA